MAATDYNQRGDGVWGIEEDETGLLIQDISHSYKSEKATLTNRVGNTVGSVYYNPTVEVSYTAYVPKTTPWMEVIGSAVTFANTFEAFIEDATGGTTVLESVTKTKANKDYQKLQIQAVYYPYVVDTPVAP